MPNYSQDNMPMRVSSPAGDDALLLERLTGSEGMSTPFEFTLDMLAPEAVQSSAVLGKPMVVEVEIPESNTPRHYHGRVRRFVQLGKSADGLTNYRAEIVPWFWFLTLTTDCRIFQNKTVLDIVKQIFDDKGMTDYRMATTGTYVTREYCVQYRESDFAFVSRLLEEEGIFYFFEHAESKHTMVLADVPTAIKAGPVPKLAAASSATAAYGEQYITEFEIEDQVASGKVSLTDYNFETPSTSLLANATSNINGSDAKLELFDYPGGYAKKGDGSSLAVVRIEEAEVMAKVFSGRTFRAPLASGEKLDIINSAALGIAASYQLVTAAHRGTNPGYRAVAGAPDTGFHFETTFTAIEASRKFRPRRVTPKATVMGVQTAVIVGPSGEEIYSDKYGRVKVQFFWDRQGNKDEQSSCWVRVASTWAGKNWGFIQLPRIGQEVIVDFLEGDPDRPIITGRVYNGEYMPPYDLPANQTQSGFKSRSSKAGGTDDFNEFRFEDKKGNEAILLHAQKDLATVVENDEVRDVQHDRTTTVKNNETKEITEGYEEITIKKGYQTITLEEGDQTIAVKQGKQTITVNADRTVEVKQGNMSTKVDMGNHATQVKMGNATMKVDLGSISYEGMQGIELKVGSNSIKIDQMGVTIKGMMVKIEGQIQTEVKGMMATLQGSAMTTVKGGITMIN